MTKRAILPLLAVLLATLPAHPEDVRDIASGRRLAELGAARAMWSDR